MKTSGKTKVTNCGAGELSFGGSTWIWYAPVSKIRKSYQSFTACRIRLFSLTTRTIFAVDYSIRPTVLSGWTFSTAPRLLLSDLFCDIASSKRTRNGSVQWPAFIPAVSISGLGTNPN
jgi:hypothetical protein